METLDLFGRLVRAPPLTHLLFYLVYNCLLVSVVGPDLASRQKLPTFVQWNKTHANFTNNEARQSRLNNLPRSVQLCNSASAVMLRKKLHQQVRKPTR